MCYDLLEKQTKKIEDEINNIKEKGMGRVGNVFKMKEIITGPKKGCQIPTAIKDPVSNELIVANEQIKKVTLEHCVKTLQNNKPAEEVKVLCELRKELQIKSKRKKTMNVKSTKSMKSTKREKERAQRKVG